MYTFKKCLYFTNNKIHAFRHFLFFYVFITTLSLSSWNRIGILHWKWISRLTIVSSVPINHELSDFYCCSTVCNLFHDAVCISIYDTNNSVIENKTQSVGQQQQANKQTIPGWLVCMYSAGHKRSTALRADLLHWFPPPTLYNTCGKYAQEFIFIPQESAVFNAVIFMNCTITQNSCVNLSCTELYPNRRKIKKGWQHFIYVLKQSMGWTEPICKKVTTA